MNKCSGNIHKNRESFLHWEEDRPSRTSQENVSDNCILPRVVSHPNSSSPSTSTNATQQRLKLQIRTYSLSQSPASTLRNILERGNLFDPREYSAAIGRGSEPVAAESNPSPCHTTSFMIDSLLNLGSEDGLTSQSNQKRIRKPLHEEGFVQRKVTSFLKSAVENLCKDFEGNREWVILFRWCWFRSLIVLIAESDLNFDFKRMSEAASTTLSFLSEPILPWLGVTGDHRQLLPTDSSTNHIEQCIRSLRRLDLTQEDYKELRECIYSSANSTDFEISRRMSNLFKIRFEVTRRGFDENIRLLMLDAFTLLANLKANDVAGLLCFHLTGDRSLDEIVLSEEMRKSIRQSGNRPE
ncbi:unnamed protein product [Hymenolepis diminuta]|uniref:NR LBD domain-containing protein n=1 Tax=Hymenolepis diminuta TaxID=6216 RepID=A0A0R3SZC6_HYMDI|nr:unnamed protein product [Hymenolepis diminuta]VUZ50743.1 unnamed protein product [Hymenolepis diminuta]